MIDFIEGDVTAISGPGKVLIHCCNDIGAFGAGVSGAIGKRWPAVEKKYRQWYQDRSWQGFGLGRVQFVQVDESFWVANMIGQRGLRKKGHPPPIDYGAIEQCLDQVADFAARRDLEVHCPKFGSGLAGGDWKIIQTLIENILVAEHLKVVVYQWDG